LQTSTGDTYDRHGMAGEAPVTIRPLAPADAGAYRELRLRALREHPDAFGRAPDEVDAVEVWAERFRVDPGSDLDFTLGAFEGDTLVGVAGCRRERLVKHRHTAYIWGMYVAPEHRGAGLGRRLFLTAVGRARTWPDLESLWLEVTTTNRGARALYASCGFRTIAIKPRTLKVDDRYYDEELMMLDLGVRSGAWTRS
jgi:ribosomal protein S18 acetylase RimI-like enzyme